MNGVRSLAETADELRSADARLAAELSDTAQGLQSQLDAHHTELEQTAAQLEAQEDSILQERSLRAEAVRAAAKRWQDAQTEKT